MATHFLASPAALQIEIEVVGSDLDGQQYIERTQTLKITRDGATILLANKLGPDSELLIRNLKTDQEALARVVGHIREEILGHVYGVALMDPSVDLWRVPFSPTEHGNSAILECSHCHVVRSVRLTGIEMEIFTSNRTLTRRCKCSVLFTIWKETNRAESVEIESALPGKPQDVHPEASSTRIQRRDKRVAIITAACIRYSGQDDIAACEDMSRGGFRFKSRKRYPAGTRIEAAVPYIHSSANIFVPAQIAYHQELPSGSHRHGVAYLTTRRKKEQG